jgi:polyphenol oxidase
MEDARVRDWQSIPGLVHGFGRRGEETPASVRDHLFLLKQVHGTTLVTPPWEAAPEADASATIAAGPILGIKTADCLPILFCEPARRVVAAAHAGWRGTAAGVARTVLDWLAGQKIDAGAVRVALGPHIGPCCYEVGDELRRQFAESEQRFFVAGPHGRPHLDMAGINEAQLLAAGVPAAHIARVDECTRCHPDLYHSYRRDGPAAGRMISYVGFPE